MNIRRLSQNAFRFAALAIALTFLIGASAWAAGLGNTKQFTVDMKMSSTMGESAGQVVNATYYVGKDRFRMDVTVAGMPGGSHIAFFDGDDVTMYMLIPQMKQYMKSVSTAGDLGDEGPALTFGSPDDADHACQSDPNTKCEKVGSDTVLGRSVDKYVVTNTEDGVPVKSTIWFDRELLFPIKVESEDGSMEATSIEIGPQPAELFEIPAGYSEMQMPNY
jgi:outer membrane lipoprotein-sorting protein